MNDLAAVNKQENSVRVLVAVVVLALFIQDSAGQEPAQAVANPVTQMSETLRASVTSVVVSPGLGPLSSDISGTYGKSTPGLLEGAMDGSGMGQGPSKDVGPVTIGIPIPILTIPGAIYGGLTGMTQEAIQKFRDALAEDLARSASQPLNNNALASGVFSDIRQINGLHAKMAGHTQPIPKGTDAILYVGLTGVGIDVQGRDAIITTTALATLRRVSDGGDIYAREVQYQDRDTLKNWTADDNELWRQYAIYARHFLGREIAAEVFGRVSVPSTLRPKATKTVSRVKKDDWQGVSKTAMPTLAWDFQVQQEAASPALPGEVEVSAITWDLEIYDAQRLVYSARKLPNTQHTVEIELPDCRTFRWSVRPVYQFGERNGFGEWMRAGGETGSANIGRQASVAPAYTQDFASLEIKCARR